MKEAQVAVLAKKLTGKTDSFWQTDRICETGRIQTGRIGRGQTPRGVDIAFSKENPGPGSGNFRPDFRDFSAGKIVLPTLGRSSIGSGSKNAPDFRSQIEI